MRSAAPPERSAAAITRAISRLGERYQWGDIERDDYLRERAALHAELAAAGELPSVDTPQMLDVTRAIALLDNIGELLAAGSSEAQRTLVHQLIDRVWLHENTIAGIRPTAAFALLTHPAMAVVCVTSTGLEPVTFSSGG